MLTKFEQECMTMQTESLRKLAGLMTEVMKDSSKIANSLEVCTKSLSSIATELHEMNGHYPNVSQSAMGPGDDEDSPF